MTRGVKRRRHPACECLLTPVMKFFWGGRGVAAAVKTGTLDRYSTYLQLSGLDVCADRGTSLVCVEQCVGQERQLIQGSE